jgi:hypothetical protein
VSEGERALLLDRALERYTAKGWQIDDRAGFGAMVSKEWGPGYGLRAVLQACLALGLARVSSDEAFKRRLVAVDRLGKLTDARMPPRGKRSSRYVDQDTPGST